MKEVFINPRQQRLRSGWRILLFLLLLIGLSVATQLITRAIRGSLPRDSILLLIIIGSCATVAVLVSRRFLDRKSFVSLGLKVDRQAWLDVLFGFLLSGLMAWLVFALMLVMGVIEQVSISEGLFRSGQSRSLSSNAVASLLLWHLIPCAIIGWWEEITFRGYLLQNMMEGLGLVTAIVISCLLYGLVHAFNPNASLLSSGIIVLFGILRLYGYLASGFLWLSIGMHTGWNYFQNTVLGFAASGHEGESLLVHQRTGPNWLNGGEFGPESSVLIIPILTLALVGMYGWVRWTRGGLYSPASTNSLKSDFR